MKNLNYIVTGCGRSGTVFLARLLTSIGIPCGHESIFDYNGLDAAKRRLSGEEQASLSFVSIYDKPNNKIIDPHVNPALIEADSSYLSAPYLNDELFSNTKIIHVVRNPIKVVNSFTNYMHYFANPSHPEFTGHLYEGFIHYHVPDLYQNLTQYERACLYWVKWNQMIEENSKGKEYLLWRVEDEIKPLLDFVYKSDVDPNTIYNDKTANTFVKNGPQFCLDSMKDSPIKKQFIALMKKYKYKTGSEYLLI